MEKIRGFEVAKGFGEYAESNPLFAHLIPEYTIPASSVTKGSEPKVMISNRRKSFNPCGIDELSYSSGVVSSENTGIVEFKMREKSKIFRIIDFLFIWNNSFLQKLQYQHEQL